MVTLFNEKIYIHIKSILSAYYKLIGNNVIFFKNSSVNKKFMGPQMAIVLQQNIKDVGNIKAPS